jgi:hypothetical protein
LLRMDPFIRVIVERAGTVGEWGAVIRCLTSDMTTYCTKCIAENVTNINTR